MAQKQKRSKKAKRGVTGQEERPAAAVTNAKDRTKKVKKGAEALLRKVDSILAEYKKGLCPRSHTPHIHLCDGTKVDLRKMFK